MNEKNTKWNDQDTPEGTMDEPVMDGAEEHREEDVDPRKGMTDPALIRDIEAGKKTTNPYG
ncbi:MAG: hypothetical protein WDA07_04775 [Leucobacter sp.]